jgi:PAS domain S-box-containing protein
LLGRELFGFLLKPQDQFLRIANSRTMVTKPYRIVFLYLLISLTWITLSDRLVQVLASITGIQSVMLQTFKGTFFVLVTAWVLYLAIKKQQKALLNFGEQYKSLFFSNPNPFWIYDHNTLRFLEVNEAAIRTYGYTQEEFKERTILEILPEEDLQRAKGFTAGISDKCFTSGNWTHIKKNGGNLTVSILAHKLKFNNRECVMVIAQDVTLRLEQEEKLKALYKVERELREELEKNLILVKQSSDSNQRLAEVVDRINNMVVITDPTGIIVWVNQAFLDFTEYSFSEVRGRDYSFLYGPNTDSEVQMKMMESIPNNSFSNFEILNYTKSGKEYWVELNISAIYNSENEVVRYIAIQNIITERKLREEKIREQNDILRKHSWTNSHAIRKPLASILSLLFLSKDMTETEEIKEMHSLIQACAEELDEIIRSIGKEINDFEKEEYL